MKDLRAKFTQEAIHDHQLGMIDGPASDLYSCEKCGSNQAKAALVSKVMHCH